MNELDDKQCANEGLRELALFAGAGGGVLAGKLLGWRTVCAVEREPYAASVLAARQNDGILEAFPIWSDVCTFDGKPGEDLLTWFLEDSLARTSQSQEKVLDSTANDQASGLRCLESFAKYDHEESMWKIAQRSLFEASEGSLETWPRWGMTVNGESFHAETSAEFTYASGSGLSLPTTGANEYRQASSKRFIGSPDFRGAKMSEGLRTCETDMTCLSPLFSELVMGFPSGWSDLRPLEMHRFRAWQQQHSIS